MRVCIVGQGPSAEGRGREIDACDFVVRMKAFWLRGAENAGEKIDAWAWYGYTGPEADGVPVEFSGPRGTEHWFTHCRQQVQNNPDTHCKRLEDARMLAGSNPFHQLPDGLWGRAKQHLNRHPSTGLVTVCMALDHFPDDELVLYGFDSTTPDKPNYQDARGRPVEPAGHNTLAEKLAIAEISRGTWLGKPTAATLTWPDMPSIGGGCA
jgi:hypothetical protein